MFQKRSGVRSGVACDAEIILFRFESVLSQFDICVTETEPNKYFPNFVVFK